MSDIRDPERDQVAPTPNDLPSCHDLVIEDMKERKQFGLRKYNSLLQPFNGRSFTQDAYEEVLDLAVYLRGKLEEERMQSEEFRLVKEGVINTLSDQLDIPQQLLESETHRSWCITQKSCNCDAGKSHG